MKYLISCGKSYEQEAEGVSVISAIRAAFLQRLPLGIGEIIAVHIWDKGKNKFSGRIGYIWTQSTLAAIGVSHLYGPGQKKLTFRLNTEHPDIVKHVISEDKCQS